MTMPANPALTDAQLLTKQNLDGCRFDLLNQVQDATRNDLKRSAQRRLETFDALCAQAAEVGALRELAAAFPLDEPCRDERGSTQGWTGRFQNFERLLREHRALKALEGKV